MDKALMYAKKGFEQGEVPIGAVIVKDNKIIAGAFNNREKTQIATNHAEIIAINKACKKLKSWRLDDCDMYVTLMPCPMCAGAILNARIKNVFYGATNLTDQNFCEQVFNHDVLNHKTNLIYLPNQNCKQILQLFFKNKR